MVASQGFIKKTNLGFASPLQLHAPDLHMRLEVPSALAIVPSEKPIEAVLPPPCLGSHQRLADNYAKKAFPISVVAANDDQRL